MTTVEVQADGTLRFRGRCYRCALGRGGISVVKREGDGVTPAGRFPLRRLLYRADRLPAPRCALPAAAIQSHDGWCDASGDAACNRQVRLPYAASAERLWREDGLYDLVLVLGHNDAPPVAGAGSAIFVHVARADYGPTEGCVALAKADLLEVLAALDESTVVAIGQPGGG